MADLAQSAFAMMSNGGGTDVLTSAQEAAGAGRAGMGASSFFDPSSKSLGALQGLVTNLSMTSQMLSGGVAFGESIGRSRFAHLDAEGARLDAERKSLDIAREMTQKIGAARVAFAGSGLDVSSGADIEASLRSQSAFEQKLAQNAGEFAAAKSNAAADIYAQKGYSSLLLAATKALGTGLDARISEARRG